jgi:hypothetical protein
MPVYLLFRVIKIYYYYSLLLVLAIEKWVYEEYWYFRVCNTIVTTQLVMSSLRRCQDWPTSPPYHLRIMIDNERRISIWHTRIGWKQRSWLKREMVTHETSDMIGNESKAILMVWSLELIVSYAGVGTIALSIQRGSASRSAMSIFFLSSARRSTASFSEWGHSVSAYEEFRTGLGLDQYRGPVEWRQRQELPVLYRGDRGDLWIDKGKHWPMNILDWPSL